MYIDAGTFADKFVMSALIGVLESSPATYVVNDDCFEIAFSGLHVSDQLPQRIAPVQAQSASAFIRIGVNNLHSVLRGVHVVRG